MPNSVSIGFGPSMKTGPKPMLTEFGIHQSLESCDTSEAKPAIFRFGTNLVYVDHLTYHECRIVLKVGKPVYAAQGTNNNAGMNTK